MCVCGPHGCCRWFFLIPLNLNLRRYSNNEKRGYLHERSSESRMSHEHYLWFIKVNAISLHPCPRSALNTRVS